MYTAEIGIEEVAGLKFLYNDSQKLTVYCDVRFYSLTEAYNNKILSRQELKAVKRNLKQ